MLHNVEHLVTTPLSWGFLCFICKDKRQSIIMLRPLSLIYISVLFLVKKKKKKIQTGRKTAKYKYFFFSK